MSDIERNPSLRSEDFATWRARGPIASVQHVYRAIRDRDDPAIFISCRRQADALEEAERLEAAGPEGKPLFGLPFAVKDNIDVAHLPTTAGCPDFAYVPAASAHVVDRLRRAGAIVVGKTNLDQFATGLVGTRSPYGVPRNALDPRLVPGGSSSGSAVAVATGLVAFSLGTDTAGSGRVPAALNGIVGMKPSLGLLSGAGMVPACRTLDTISIFAATVADAAEATAAAAGFDPADPWSRRLPAPGIGAVPPAPTVGVPRPADRVFFGDDQAEAAYAADLEALERIGARLVEIAFAPFFDVARLLYEGPWVAERYAAVRTIIETQPDALHPVTRAIIGGATRFSAVDAFEALYRLAALKRRIEPLLGGLDALAVPSIPTVYTVEEVLAEPVRLNSNLGTWTNFVNLLDLAAISVPVGRRADGLPSSLTLIGQAGSDTALAGLAQALETGRRPAMPAPGHGAIELAVVGAHLSGMPLNHELATAGATFLRAAETRPEYRLFALPGTVPAKPGLLRVAEGAGSAIAVEVWALPADGFGRFVAAIPPPLGIGTLRLVDGTAPKGFLVEAQAVEGARDVSSFGGWRAFVASGG